MFSLFTWHHLFAGMAGDVNLFLHSHLGDHAAEIEVMIAEASSRGHGLGSEAVLMMMRYAQLRLGLKTFIAKISADNAPSLRMFRKLGYQEVQYVEAFEEYELKFDTETSPPLPEIHETKLEEISLSSSSFSSQTSSTSASSLSSSSAAFPSDCKSPHR